MSTEPRFEDRFATWLTRALGTAATAAALRAGDHPATMERAYPHLARWWGDASHRREPLLLVSAVIARTGIRHRAGVTVASMSRRVTQKASSASVETRVLAAYRQPLPRAHAQFTALLRLAASHNIPVDYSDLIRLYLHWDAPYSADIRRRFLNDFYTAATPTTAASEA